MTVVVFFVPCSRNFPPIVVQPKRMAKLVGNRFSNALDAAIENPARNRVGICIARSSKAAGHGHAAFCVIFIPLTGGGNDAPHPSASLSVVVTAAVGGYIHIEGQVILLHPVPDLGDLRGGKGGRVRHDRITTVPYFPF